MCIRDSYKLGEEQRTRLIALLDDFPEYCCLIFVYDLVEYKPVSYTHLSKVDDALAAVDDLVLKVVG